MRQGAITRRSLLQGAAFIGASAFIVGGIAAPKAASAGDAENESGSKGVQYGFLIDASKCVGCETCVAACRGANNLSDETPDRRRISRFVDENGNGMSMSTSCMHCADPSCMRVCPAGAIKKGDAGIVSVDASRCIGCKYCYQACPYDVPRYNDISMDKCDCCLTAGVAAGETPYCVRACIYGALEYGPIEELKAKSPDAVVIGDVNDPSCLVLA